MHNCLMKLWGRLRPVLLMLFVFSFVACQQKPPVINQFYADNSTIIYGEKVQLSWSVIGADSISIKDEYGNIITITSSENVCTMKPLETTSYTIVASNNAGIANKTVVVGVSSISVDWIETGDTCFIQGNYDEASGAYSSAIKLNPENASLYLKRGNTYYVTGKYDLASTDYNQAMELNPNDKDLAKIAKSIEQLVTPQKNTDMLPYSFRRTNQDQLYFRNQSYAKNPTWQELAKFLSRDKTENQPYNFTSLRCGELAIILHDKAENAGISCGLVGIYFRDQKDGHAVNVFKTTDRGLVFITSQQLIYCNGDRVCYLMVGKELGEIPIELATAFDYSYYEKYIRAQEDYRQQLKAYNDEVKEFNDYVKYGFLKDSPEYFKAKSREDELSKKSSHLEAMERQFSKCLSKPMGIVDRYEIYW